jgi:hypothetical protein
MSPFCGRASRTWRGPPGGFEPPDLLIRSWCQARTAGSFYTRDGVHVDLAFLARDEEGTVYTRLQSGRGDWPPGSFGSDVRRLAGIRASVVTVASLIADKSQVRDDPTSATKDGADVAVLQSLKQ